MKKMALAFVLASIFLVSSLAGCSSTSGGGGGTTGALDLAPAEYKGQVVHWTWFSDILEEWIAEFNKTYPNIDMKVVVYSYQDYHDKLRTSLAGGGGAPDLIELEDNQMTWIKKTGQLEDLGSAPYNADTSLFFKSSVDMFRDDEGVLVGLPEAVAPAGIFYNRKVIRECFGFDDPDQVKALIGSGEKSYDKFIDAMKTVVEVSGGRYKGVARLGDILGMIHSQKGNKFFDGNKVIYEDTHYDDFQMLQKICELDLTAKMSGAEDDNSFTQSIQNETIAFYPGANWYIGYVIPSDEANAGKWGFIPSPGPGWDRGSQATAIYKGSKVKDLAYQWIKWYIMTEEGAITQYKSGSITPGLISAYSRPELMEDLEPTTNQKLAAIYLEISNTVQLASFLQENQAIFDVVGPVMNSMEQGALNGDEAIKKVVDEALKRLTGYTR